MHSHAPGHYDEPESEGVAQTYFTANPNINVFGSFGDQMAAGAMTAIQLVGGYTPGKNLEVTGAGGTNQVVAEIKAGTVRHARPVPGLGVENRHQSPGGRAQRASRCRTWSTSSTSDAPGDHRPGLPEVASVLHAGLVARGRAGVANRSSKGRSRTSRMTIENLEPDERIGSRDDPARLDREALLRDERSR